MGTFLGGEYFEEASACYIYRCVEIEKVAWRRRIILPNFEFSVTSVYHVDFNMLKLEQTVQFQKANHYLYLRCSKESRFPLARNLSSPISWSLAEGYSLLISVA
jgi:hypothetical protein